MLPFSLLKHCCVLSNCGFATVFVASKITGLRHLGRIAGEYQHYGSSKNGHSEANHLATVGCQSDVMVR
jgi:hypothetical protein